MRANAHSTSKYQWPLDDLFVKFLRTRLIRTLVISVVSQRTTHLGRLLEPLGRLRSLQGGRFTSMIKLMVFPFTSPTTGEETMQLDLGYCLMLWYLSCSLSLSLSCFSPASWFSGRVFAFSLVVSFQKGSLKWWDFEMTSCVFWFPREAAKMWTGPLPAQTYWPHLQSGRGVHQSNRSPNLEMLCQGMSRVWVSLGVSPFSKAQSKRSVRVLEVHWHSLALCILRAGPCVWLCYFCLHSNSCAFRWEYWRRGLQWKRVAGTSRHHRCHLLLRRGITESQRYNSTKKGQLWILMILLFHLCI